MSDSEKSHSSFLTPIFPPLPNTYHRLLWLHFITAQPITVGANLEVLGGIMQHDCLLCRNDTSPQLTYSEHMSLTIPFLLIVSFCSTVLHRANLSPFFEDLRTCSISIHCCHPTETTGSQLRHSCVLEVLPAIFTSNSTVSSISADAPGDTDGEDLRSSSLLLYVPQNSLSLQF